MNRDQLAQSDTLGPNQRTRSSSAGIETTSNVSEMYRRRATDQSRSTSGNRVAEENNPEFLRAEQPLAQSNIRYNDPGEWTSRWRHQANYPNILPPDQRAPDRNWLQENLEFSIVEWLNFLLDHPAHMAEAPRAAQDLYKKVMEKAKKILQEQAALREP